MAFNNNTAQASNNNQRNDNWKASGFINLYLPSKQGGRRKLGAIPLKANRAAEKQLLDWLTENPARAAVIASQLVVEFQSAIPDDQSGFALPSDAEQPSE